MSPENSRVEPPRERTASAQWEGRNIRPQSPERLRYSPPINVDTFYKPVRALQRVQRDAEFTMVFTPELTVVVSEDAHSVGLAQIAHTDRPFTGNPYGFTMSQHDMEALLLAPFSRGQYTEDDVLMLGLKGADPGRVFLINSANEIHTSAPFTLPNLPLSYIARPDQLESGTQIKTGELKEMLRECKTSRIAWDINDTRIAVCEPQNSRAGNDSHPITDKATASRITRVFGQNQLLTVHQQTGMWEDGEESPSVYITDGESVVFRLKTE